MTSKHKVREHFAQQAGYCNVLRSPFYGRFIAACGERLSEDTEVGRHVLGWSGDPTTDALALRFAGALRFLALNGVEPSLAELYGEGRTGALDDRDWQRIRNALERHEAAILEFLSLAVQTNEVGRSFALLGGFLYLAERFGLPLRLFEVGASAGLNMLWDRWHYDTESWRWGANNAALRMSCDWRGGRPDGGLLEIAGRRSSDLRPIDVRDPQQRSRLLAYVWPDQADRLQRVRVAMSEFAKTDFRVETGSATTWLGNTLPVECEGELRVIYHSVMWQYLSPKAQRELSDLIASFGERASRTSPLVWMQLEPASERRCAELNVKAWPDGTSRVLANADYQGRWVEWHVK